MWRLDQIHALTEAAGEHDGDRKMDDLKLLYRAYNRFTVNRSNGRRKVRGAAGSEESSAIGSKSRRECS